MRRRIDAGTILILTPLLWGATFPGAKLALRRLPVVSFMAWSRTLGFLTILLLLPILTRAGREPRRPLRKAILPGLLLGGFMFAGYFLQTEGLARTTATNAGFITGLYVVFTPILAAIFFTQRAPRSAWLAVAISLAGLTLLSIRELNELRLHLGDLLVLAGSLAWACHIVAVGHYARRFSPWLLSLAQMGAAALIHLLVATPTGLRLGAAAGAKVWPLLLLTGVFGSGVAFTIQIVAQQRITTTRAVVLLAGEALFSAAFSAVWIGERLSVHQWVGAVLVLGAMAYSELSSRRPRETRLEPASAA